MEKSRITIYMAGPLFTIGESEFNRDLAFQIRQRGYDVILPQDLPVLMNEDGTLDTKHTFNVDVGGLDVADVVVACMDGPDADSGTAWECGYAYGKGKPVIMYRTDIRYGGDSEHGFNLMLSESAEDIIPIAFMDGENAATIAIRIHEIIQKLGRIDDDKGRACIENCGD